MEEVLGVALDTRPPLVAEVSRRAGDGLHLVEGTAVDAAFKAAGVLSYPAG